MLTGLEEISASIRRDFDLLDKAREGAYVASRQVVRSSSEVIKGAHRGEFELAAEGLRETRVLCHQMLDAVKDAPELRYGGFVSDAEKEYAEAAVTLATLTDAPLPTPEDLGIYPAAWLNGLAEVVGEYRRHVLDMIRLDNNEEAERFLDAMDSIYQVIMSFDYPNAISLGLRGRSDAARGLIERTRGDLTTALRAGRLEKRMKELEAKLNAAAG